MKIEQFDEQSRPTEVLEASLDEVTISELLSYRISRIAGALSQSAGLLYRRKFDVSIGEWRTIALLGADAPLTLNRLARRAGLDKAQMSRVVKGLVERGLVDRTRGIGRSTVLTLSEAGQATYQGLITEANERDRRLRRHLGARDEASLLRALDTLGGLARVMKEEQEHAIEMQTKDN